MFSLADNSYPEIKLIMASTAPLSQPLAQQVQARFGCPVWEIYGSTETGSVATRNPCLDQPWQLLPGIQLKLIKGSWLLSAAHLPETIVLQDCLELLGSSRFRWLGRNQDMVKIAGKRSSLSALNQQLTSIPGVLDGVFIKPETEPNHATGIRRLMALVVAPGATEASILAALRQCIEPVFLPRPLYLVDRLPRAANGKLTRASLEQLLNDLGTQS
jgi:acyl-coenzyme A synthetase/AMP-(fatty) acid ligase